MSSYYITGVTGSIGSEIADYFKTHQVTDINDANVVIHCAGRDTENLNAAINDNVCYLEQVLKAAILAGVSEFYYLSSAGVYTPCNDGAAVESAINVNIYTASKLLAEAVLEKYSSDITVVVLRLPGVLTKAPGKSLFFRILNTIKNGDTVHIKNAGCKFNWLTFSSEVARFIRFFKGQKKSAFTVLNFASSACYTLEDYVKRIADYHACDYKVEPDTAVSTCLSVQKLVETGFVEEDPMCLFDRWLQVHSHTEV